MEISNPYIERTIDKRGRSQFRVRMNDWPGVAGPFRSLRKARKVASLWIDVKNRRGWTSH